MIGGDFLLYAKKMMDTDPPLCKTPNFQSIFARNASAVTLSKKFN